jgi:PD-(D/E)XK nuclease superfamily
VDYGTGAHGAWLFGDIKVAIVEPPIADSAFGLCNRQDFGVRSGVLEGLNLVPSAGDDIAARNDDRPDRNLLGRPCSSRLAEGFPHEISITRKIQHMKMHRTEMRPGSEDKSFRTGGRRGGGFALGSGSTAAGAKRILFLLSHLARVVGQPYEMHPDFSNAAGLTSAIIGAAIEVHRDKGPGLIESIYQWSLLFKNFCLFGCGHAALWSL